MISILRKIALEWGSKVRLGNHSASEAWTAPHASVSARFKYPVTTCTFTEDECKSMIYPSIKAALSNAGVVSTMETAVRGGTVSTLGT